MSTVVVTQSPTSARVRAELVVLRQREGLTMIKLNERCPNICKLAVTQLELERLGLEADDLHVAASMVIKCAIQTLVKRKDYALILRMTLNLDEESIDLERRRRALTDRLKISFKRLRKLEEDAYTEFAGILVSCRQSPCGFEQELPTITFEVRMQVNPYQLRAILDQLSPEERSTLRETISQGVATAFSDGHQLLASLQKNGEGDSAELDRLVLAAINKYWPQNETTNVSFWRPAAAYLRDHVEWAEPGDFKNISLAEVIYKRDATFWDIRRVSLNSLWKLSEQVITMADDIRRPGIRLKITRDVSPRKKPD